MYKLFLPICCFICLQALQSGFAQTHQEMIQQRIDKLQTEIDAMKPWVSNQDASAKPTIYWTFNGLLTGASHTLVGLGGLYHGYVGTQAALENWERQPGATVALGVSMFSLANAGFAAYSLIGYADKELDVDARNRHRRNFWISVGAETLLLTTLYTVASIHDHRLVKAKVLKQAELQLLQEQLKRFSIEHRPDSGKLTLRYRVRF